MTNVIRRKQTSPRPVCILTPNYVNARDTAKHEPHEQLASVIHGRVHLCITSVSRFMTGRKVIFSG